MVASFGGFFVFAVLLTLGGTQFKCSRLGKSHQARCAAEQERDSLWGVLDGEKDFDIF
jgi:hypothetical protein